MISRLRYSWMERKPAKGDGAVQQAQFNVEVL